jgi:hypothetical protein
VADGVEFRESRTGWAQVLRSPAMQAEMRRLADLGRVEAERISPVVTGAYAFAARPPNGAHGGGFRVTSGIRDGVAYARLSNSVRSRDNFPYAVALEYGTKYMRKQRILGRAIDALAAKQ